MKCRFLLAVCLSLPLLLACPAGFGTPPPGGGGGGGFVPDGSVPPGGECRRHIECEEAGAEIYILIGENDDSSCHGPPLPKQECDSLTDCEPIGGPDRPRKPAGRDPSFLQRPPAPLSSAEHPMPGTTTPDTALAGACTMREHMPRQLP